MLAATASASLAERFIAETADKQGVASGTRTLHRDRGTSTHSRAVSEMLDDLRVTKSDSRPRTSIDNPFSERQLKTMKCCPFFPSRLASVAEGREFFRLFFWWYDEEHHHSGIAMQTPTMVHAGRVDDVLGVRQAPLDATHAAHPDRFVPGAPRAQRPPAKVWINRPAAHVVEPPSGFAEPPPEESACPSPARRVDRELAAQATERPELPGPTRSAQRERG
jgi:putative transposase